MSDALNFASPRGPDGRATLRVVPVGELSPETQRLEAERTAWERDLLARGREAFSRYSEAKIPEAAALRCDVSGLSVGRAMLVRLEAWRAQLAAEVDRYEGELAALKLKPGRGVNGAREALSVLDRAERVAHADWLKSGSAGARPAPRTEDRARLEREIAEAEWQADVAAEAVREVEGSLTATQAGIDALKARKPDLIAAVMQASAAPIEQEIGVLMQGEIADLGEQISSLLRQMDAAARRVAHKHMCLLGLEIATGREVRAIAFELPHRRPVTVTAEESAGAADAWREFARQLDSDPRAQNDTEASGA